MNGQIAIVEIQENRVKQGKTGSKVKKIGFTFLADFGKKES